MSSAYQQPLPRLWRTLRVLIVNRCCSLSPQLVYHLRVSRSMMVKSSLSSISMQMSMAFKACSAISR